MKSIFIKKKTLYGFLVLILLIEFVSATLQIGGTPSLVPGGISINTPASASGGTFNATYNSFAYNQSTIIPDISYYHINSSVNKNRFTILGGTGLSGLGTTGLIDTGRIFMLPFITGIGGTVNVTSVNEGTGVNATMGFMFGLYNSTKGDGICPYNLMWNSTRHYYDTIGTINITGTYSIPPNQIWLTAFATNGTSYSGSPVMKTINSASMGLGAFVGIADDFTNTANGQLTTNFTYNSNTQFPSIILCANVSAANVSINSIAIGVKYV